jgi:hypothetical protein
MMNSKELPVEELSTIPWCSIELLARTHRRSHAELVVRGKETQRVHIHALYGLGEGAAHGDLKAA